MNSQQYQEDCLKTENKNYDEVQKRLNDPKMARLLHAAMGLMTEAGEFVDQLKRHLYYGKPLDEVNLREELGDSLWYISIALSTLDSNYDSVMERNIEKLKVRYPHKFTEELALERNLEKEREALE